MSAKPNRLSIEATGGKAAPAELPQQGKLVIGSSKDKAGFVLSGQGVADVHCTIGRIKGGGWALKDLGSEFGTMVNGQRVGSARLNAGDTILIGSVRMRVFDPANPNAAAPQASPTTPAAKAAAPTASARPAAPATLPSPAPKKADLAPAAVKPASAPVPRSAGRAGLPEVPGYAISSLLGQGGMGQVYLAEQTSLARKVALKVLSPKLEADTAFVDQFQAEARAAAALNHPNVVTVFDVGEHAGHHYLSMEYMDGGCLESRLQSLGPVPWREALSILLDASRGLEYAESRGIVHRDIKPANLMQNRDGVTKIADLGLAIQSDDEETPGGKKLVGTPHFIAPELIRGSTPDHRSDLYSLGATAFRILSGHTPFEGNTTKEILRGALNDEPPPLNELVAGLPAGIAAMVARLLSKEPSDRHPSAAVLVQEIDRLRSGQAAPPAPVMAGKSKLPKLVGAGVLVIGAVITAVVLSSGDDDPTDPNEGGDERSTAVTEGIVPDEGGDPQTATENGGTDTPDPTAETPDGNEESEEAYENRAKVAYYQLKERSLSDADRIIALRALAQEFLGTDTARSAGEDADSLSDRLAAEVAAETARNKRVAEVLASLRGAADLESAVPRPGDALRAMVAVHGQEELADNADFQAQRAALMDQVLDRAVAYVRAQWDEAEKLETAGQFDGVQKSLSDLLPLFDLPEFTPETEPEQVRTLAQLRSNVRTRLDVLPTRRTDYIANRSSADDSAVAQEFGGPGGLEAELRAFDFEAAVARIEKTQAALSSDRARARLDPIRADLEIAGDALRAVGAAWNAGEWKRQTVRNPLKRGANADATNATEVGVSISSSSGDALVPWSKWCGKTDMLENVFKGRLSRPWTADEMRSIAALMRVSAVVEAIDLAGQMLRPTSGEPQMRFSVEEGEKLLEAFEQAKSWSQDSGTEAALQRERAAAELLVEALRAASDESWTQAVTFIERLLGEQRDSLLVLLLSDGGAV